MRAQLEADTVKTRGIETKTISEWDNKEKQKIAALELMVQQTTSEGEKEREMIAAIDMMMQQKISESRLKGEITDKRARELEAWWSEFVAIYKLPLEKRTESIQEVILRGIAQFRDVPSFAAMMEGLSGKKVSAPARPSNVCPFCSGTGKGEKCWKCNGDGYLTSRMRSPWGSGTYIDQNFTCDHCYGRGYEVCYKCGGRRTRD